MSIESDMTLRFGETVYMGGILGSAGLGKVGEGGDQLEWDLEEEK